MGAVISFPPTATANAQDERPWPLYWHRMAPEARLARLADICRTYPKTAATIIAALAEVADPTKVGLSYALIASLIANAEGSKRVEPEAPTPTP